MAATKLTALILVFCFVAVFCKAAGKSENKDGNEPSRHGSVHHLNKRSLYHEDGDGNIGNDFLESSFENAFERPHKIRVLPGYLH